MEYENALAMAKSSIAKPKHAYAVIKLSYSNQIIMEYGEAMKLLALLQNAEQYSDRALYEGQVSPLNMDRLEVIPVTEDNYLRGKIAALLDVTFREVASIEQTRAENQQDEPA